MNNGFFDDVIDDFFKSDFFKGRLGTKLHEIKNGRISFNVAGFNEKNLNVNNEGNTIHIYGENEFGTKLDYKFSSSSLRDKPKSAKIKDGVLTIEFEKPKEIEKINLLET